MRRFLIATTLAVAFAPAVTLDAFAASGLVMARKYDLTCEIKRVRGAVYTTVHNTTQQTIPRGTRIEVIVVTDAAGRTVGARRSVTVRHLGLAPNQSLHSPGGTEGAKSCTASVRLVPDHIRR